MILRVLIVTVTFLASVCAEKKITSLGDWEPPLDLVMRFPYYLSGFDDESRPVFVCEFGKWNLRAYFDNSRDINVLRKYIQQGFYRLFNVTYTQGDPAEGTVIILDLNGFSIHQITSTATLKFILELARQITIYEERFAYGFFINLNFIAERALELAKPYLGSIMERVDVYGTNPSKWIPKLLKKIPQKQLPPWYGGTKNFKPVEVYG